MVGLEVHVELATCSKMYCGCKNSFGAPVNSNICPICTGLPGTLPTLNKKVVEYAIKAGIAMNCKINKKSKQDRKNYFYPDLPKGYQISQNDYPICYDGYLDIIVGADGETKRVRITQSHIEEDTAKLIHDNEGKVSFLDLNRSGVPLIEIVSEPDISSPEEAKIYLETLKSILQSIGVSDVKMQEGSIRCDVNVSVKPKGSSILGTKCEMKNINTFTGVVKAIDYELNRHKTILQSGGIVRSETRRWDDEAVENVFLRPKESTHIYRYFPEPDLPAICVSDEFLAEIRSNMPELPNDRIRRFISNYKIPIIDAITLVNDKEKADFFEQTVSIYDKNDFKIFSNWILGDISRILNEKRITLKETNITSKKFIQIIKLINDQQISNTSAKLVIEEIMLNDIDVEIVVDKYELRQVNDELELEEIVKKVLKENPQVKEMFDRGKTNIVGFAVGQCMKLSKGKGNPSILNKMVVEALSR